MAEIFSNLASDIGAPLFLGSLIIATLIALPLYPVVHIMLKRHQSENGRALKPGKPAGAGETIQDKKKGKDGKPGLIKSDSGEAIQDSQSLKIP
ncbi:MAG: DUF2062 domain-containing protein [Planctomycetes bacterium]|nr:DUF2062 domain-containing protein [Planctomycetota bacterium]